MKLYENPDPMIRGVRTFEEKACANFATPDPSCSLQQAPGKRISRHHERQLLKKGVEVKLKEKVEDQRWQGRMLWARWEDDQLSRQGIFAWLSGWACAPTHTVAGVMEIYEQLLPTRVYALIRPVLQTKLTPCAECAVPERYQKAILTFWRDVHRWHRLNTWTGIILHLRCCSLTCWGTSSLPTLFLLTGGAQTVVLVSRRSSILECSGLRRAHFRSSQQRGRAICRPQGDEGVGCGNELSMVGQ